MSRGRARKWPWNAILQGFNRQNRRKTLCTPGIAGTSRFMVRFLSILAVCAAVWASDPAEGFYKAAQRAEKAGDILHAYLLYSRASTLDPKNVQYAAKKAALRGMAALSTSQEVAADPAGPPAPPMEPTITPDDLRTLT